MEFNLPTTKTEMYTILKDLFYYYRVRKEGYQEVNLVELDLPRLIIQEMTEEEFIEKAKNLLKGQHEREILSYENGINSQILELEKKKSLIEQNAISEIEKVNVLYSESVKKVENQVVKAGLFNSSIIVDKTVVLEDSLNDKISRITQDKNQQIASIDAKITALNGELLNSKSYFENIHQMEIDKKILELKDDYQKLITETFKYNNALEEKEQRYSNSIKETKASLYIRFLDVSSGEYTKDQLVEMGYYTDVIRCVRGYYDTLPADTAFRDMNAEGDLMIYLDDYYDQMLYAYRTSVGF